MIRALFASIFAALLLAGCARIVPGGTPATSDTTRQALPPPAPAAARDTTRPHLPPPPPAPSPSASDALVRSVHERINAYRAEHGLRPLLLDPALSRLAEDHSRKMAVGEIPFGHAGFQERAQAIRRSRSYTRLGENVGFNWGHADPAADAVEGWLGSPQHLANIAGDYELAGIGIARNDRWEFYFTQIFLKP